MNCHREIIHFRMMNVHLMQENVDVFWKIIVSRKK